MTTAVACVVQYKEDLPAIGQAMSRKHPKWKQDMHPESKDDGSDSGVIEKNHIKSAKRKRAAEYVLRKRLRGKTFPPLTGTAFVFKTEEI